MNNISAQRFNTKYVDTSLQTLDSNVLIQVVSWQYGLGFVWGHLFLQLYCSFMFMTIFEATGKKKNVVHSEATNVQCSHPRRR